jgi:hypothetical protein
MHCYRFVILLILIISLGNQITLGQDRYRSSSGLVQFNASTPLEDIRAVNNHVNVILTDTGELAVVLLVSEFEFPRKLMQEHFNENYIESEKYPKSYFVGTTNEFDFQSLGEDTTKISITGDLNLHGVTKKITVQANINKITDGIVLKSSFIIRPEDFEVAIPTLMFKKIAREVEVSFAFQMPRQ